MAAPTIAGLIGDVAELMLADLDRLGGEMDAAVFELAPALGADAAIAMEVSATAPTPRASSPCSRGVTAGPRPSTSRPRR